MEEKIFVDVSGFLELLSVCKHAKPHLIKFSFLCCVLRVKHEVKFCLCENILCKQCDSVLINLFFLLLDFNYVAMHFITKVYWKYDKLTK